MRFYIDPGTGSMLFTILVGILGAGIYALKNVFMKIRFIASGGKQEKMNAKKIPFAIFTDSKRYWNVFEPICKEFDKRGKKLVYMTASSDDPALDEKFENVECEFIGEGNKAFAKLNMLNADVVLSSTPGLDVYQWKRSKDVKHYSHILHAANDATAYRMFGIDYFDSVLLSGDYQVDQVRKLEEIRHLPAKDLQVVGLPHLDEMRKRLQNAEPIEEGPTTVLLAPSWGENSIFNRYGEKMIDALLATGYHIIIRPHPQSRTSEKEMLDGLMAKYPESDQLEWNSDNDNFNVLRRSSILISDFSGVIFDFSLIFDKPIIYADTSFDKAPLDAYWLDEDLWTFSILSKIGEQLTNDNLGSIKEIIDKCLSDPKYQEGRDLARKETWANIGSSAERVVDYLIGVQDKIRLEDEQKYAEMSKKSNKESKDNKKDKKNKNKNKKK